MTPERSFRFFHQPNTSPNHSLYTYKIPVVTSLCTGIGLLMQPAEARVYDVYSYDGSTFTFNDSNYQTLRDGSFVFTETSSVDTRNHTYSIIGAKGVNTIVDISSNGLSEWSLKNLSCSGNYNGYDCTSYIVGPTHNAINFASAEKGAQVTIQSLDASNPLRIDAGSMKLSMVYKDDTDAISNTSRISLKNVVYKTDYQFSSALNDQLSSSTSAAPSIQKAADAPFNPNFVIENSTIYGLRLASFTHSDVYIKNSQFLGYIPINWVPVGAPMPPAEQLLSDTSSGTGIGIQLFARNGRIVADGLFYRASSGISLVTGAYPPVPTNLDRGNFGTLEMKNSEVIIYKINESAITSMTGVRANNPLITKVNLDNVALTTYGENSSALFSNYSNGIVKNSIVTTYGNDSWGIHNDVHGNYTIENTDITTHGISSHAVLGTASTGTGTTEAVTGPVTIRFTNGSVTTHGESTYGIYAGTVSRGTIPTEVLLQGNLNATSATNSTGGVRLHSTGNFSNMIGILGGATGVASGVAANVEGDNSTFAKISGNLVNPNINKTFRSTFTLDNAALQTSGNNSFLFHLVSGGAVDVSNIYAQSTGQNAHFLVQQGTTIAYLSDANIQLKGADSQFIFSQGRSSPLASTFSSYQTAQALGSVTESGGIENDKYSPLLGGNLETKSLILNNVQLNNERGMGFVLLGGETNHITINDSTLQAGTELAANNQWILYADNYRTYDISNVLTGNYAAKDILLVATNSTMNGSVYLQGDSQLNAFTLDTSTLNGDVYLNDNSQFANFDLKNNSLWKGATFQDSNLGAIQQLQIDNTSTWEVFDGTTSHIGTLNNAGTIRFVPGATNNFQTIHVDSDYTGGGTIIMNGAYRSNDTDSERDQLFIAGNVLGSTTQVRFQSVDNIGAQTVGNGIKVIEVAGTSQPSDFQQQGNLYAGLYSYTLRPGTADGTFDGAWYLSSDYDPTLEPPLLIPSNRPPLILLPGELPPFIPPNPGPGPEPTDPLIPEVKPKDPVLPSIPNYRPEVVVSSIIPSIAYAAGMEQIATYQDRIAGTDDRIPGSGQWFRHFHTKSDIQYSNNGSVANKVHVFEENGANYDSTMHGFQVGMDLLRSDNASDTTSSALQPMHKAGVYAGVARTRAHVDDIQTTAEVGSVGMTNLTLGAYYTEHFESGLYTDNNVAVNFLQDISSNTYDSPQGPATTSGHAFIVSTELGYRHQISEEMFIEPQVQAVYQTMSIKDLDIAPDLQAAFENTDALTTRVSVRVGTRFGEEQKNTAYVRAGYEQSHASQADIHYHNPQIGDSTKRVLHNEMHGSWMKVDAGVNGEIAKNTIGYATIDYAHGTGDSESQRVGLKVGFQYHF